MGLAPFPISHNMLSREPVADLPSTFNLDMHDPSINTLPWDSASCAHARFGSSCSPEDPEEETIPDGHEIWREIVYHPTENLLRVVGEVTLRTSGLDNDILQRLGKVEDSVSHAYQWLVEFALLDLLGSAATGVVPVGGQKGTVALDSFDGWPPQFLPVLGGMQDVLHKNVDVGENPIAFGVSDDVLVVLGAVAFLSLIRIELEPLQDG